MEYYLQWDCLLIIDFVVAEEFISDTSSRDMIYDSLIKNGYPSILCYGVLGENRFDFCLLIIYISKQYLIMVSFGTLILLFLTTISIKSLIKTKGSLSQQWLMIWIVFVFVRGIYGGGVLRFETFMLIGCCLRVLRMKLMIFNNNGKKRIHILSDRFIKFDTGNVTVGGIQTYGRIFLKLRTGWALRSLFMTLIPKRE